MTEITLDRPSAISPFDLSIYSAPLVNPLDGGSQPLKDWGSFRQIDFIRPHQTKAEGLVRKLALVSIPLPSGTENLGQEMMDELHLMITGQEKADITPFNDEDTLLATTHAVRKDVDVMVVLKAFYDSTRTVIMRHKNLIDFESPQVQDYLALDEIRISYIPQLAEQIENIITNPKAIGISAWDSINGAILMENRHANGILTGTDPNGNEFIVDEKLAAGEYGHKKWLPWFKDDGVSNSVADVNSTEMTLLEHYDGTETVSACGQSEGCSAFFRKVIHNLSSGVAEIRDMANEVVLDIKRTIKLMGGTKFALAGQLGGLDQEENCPYCGKDKDSKCHCEDQDQKNQKD